LSTRIIYIRATVQKIRRFKGYGFKLKSNKLSRDESAILENKIEAYRKY
jgi:hypothetical protein